MVAVTLAGGVPLLVKKKPLTDAEMGATLGSGPRSARSVREAD